MSDSDDQKTSDEENAVDDASETPDSATTAVDEPDATDETDESEAVEAGAVEETNRRAGVDWARVAAYGVLPALALILAMAAGYLKYVDNSVREDGTARIQSVQAATASTVAILSYRPDKVEQQLNDARNLLTGEFRDSYTSLINGVVIPGAKQQQISAVATVPRAGSVSADPSHAVVLVFVNQTVVVGTGAPSSTASSVSVTLDKVGDKWLISEFTPV
ncbi:MAG: Mce-associated rane protein [Mycobacterium sp.]|nr:Mce-associated rane protein [Mycobacterium sp.]